MAVSLALAHRIDRLARRAHRFHRFAHHPLCGQYRGELLLLGARTRVCRGCALTLLSLSSGALCAALFILPNMPLILLSVACLAALLTSVLRVRTPKLVRVSKLWTRGVPGFTVGATITSLLRTPDVMQIALAIGLVLTCAVWLAGYRRRGPDRSPCLRCPEYALSQPCSGFREIVRAERAFTRRAQQLMDAAAADATLSS